MWWTVSLASQIGARPELPGADRDIVGQHLVGELHGEHTLHVLRFVRQDVLRHLDDQIGLAERVSAVVGVGEPDRRRRLGLVARRRAAVHPREDGVDLLVAETALVREDPLGGVGKPRRHLAAFDLQRDGAGPRPRVLIGHERHRRDQAADVLPRRPVARHAIGLEDRRDLLVKGHGVGGIASGRGSGQHHG